MNAVDGDHLALLGDVVAFSREIKSLRGRLPILTFNGFSSPGYGFDTLAVPRRSVYDYDKNEFPEVSKSALVVFPAFACEFSGNEDEPEAVYRVTRAIHIATLGRDPQPYLKVKYRNQQFGGVTEGDGRHLMPFNALEREIRQLQNVGGAFVEFETFVGDVWRLSWNGAVLVEGTVTSVLSLDAAVDFARSAVFDGRRTPP